MEKEKVLPILAAITYSVIFGLTFLFVKIGLETMTSMEIIAYRFLIAALVLTAFRLLKLVKIDLRDKNLKMVIGTAMFQPVLYFLFETNGINLSTTSESGLVLSLIPIFVAILARIFLDEKLLKSQIGFIILSVAGVVLINLMKDKTTVSGSYLGVFLLFMAVLSAAFHNIGSKKSSENFTPVEITYVMVWTGAIVFNIILFLTKAYSGTLSQYFTPMLNVKNLLALSYLGIASSIFGFFLVNYAISKLPVYQSAIFGNISTIVAILTGVIVLKEEFGFFDIVGATMIITGILGTVYMGERKIKQKN